MNDTENGRERNILHAVLFAAATALPQLILLLLNIRYYGIVSGECEPEQLRLMHISGGVETVVFVFFAAVSVYHLLRRRDIRFPCLLAALVLPVVSLWIFSADFDRFFPWFPAWIISSDHVIFYQYAFMMPAVIYALMRLSIVGISRVNLKQALVIAGALVGIPLLWYLFGLAATRLEIFSHFRGNEKIITAAVMVFFILTTAVLLLALFRLLAAACRTVFARGKRWRTALIALVGIVLPVGGLLLNIAIPFPSDYQRPAFYVLAVVNGLALCVPATSNPRIGRAAFIGRALLFPFTLYFFLSFLPFIPLSIPAMLAAGAGFLILTPFVLFLIHVRILAEDLETETRRTGAFAARAMLAASVLVIPLVFAVTAHYDRMQLNSALEYIYEADYAKDTSFRGSAEAVRDVLERQERMKRGSQLPFIDAFYNWIVFDNLVLPDAKADYIHKAFFGAPVKRAADNDIGWAGFLFSAPEPPRVRDAAAVAKEGNSSGVVLSSLTASTRNDGGFIRTEAVIEMKNGGERQNEFRAEIGVSDGVLVSGYWLEVGKEKVPGRIFEKKAALWVYEAIRTAQRDPGILFYRGDRSLLLKVFPFSPDETRRTGIEFIYPAGAAPQITIAGRKVSLPAAAELSPLTAEGKASVTAFIPAKEKSALPLVTRRPHIYLIADRSVSGVSSEAIARTVKLCREKMPDAAGLTLLAANYECVTAAEGIADAQTMNDRRLDKLMPKNGSFCADRALRHALMSAAADGGTFPLPVLLTDGTSMLREDNGSWFARCAPDTQGFYFTDGTSLRAESFDGKTLQSLVFRPVRRAEAGGKTVYCADDGSDTAAVIEREAADSGSQQSLYLRALACAGDHAVMMRNPSLTEKLRRGLVMSAKGSGILNGAASYIVVESPSQWKILEEKEKQKLKGKDSLEISQSPEPPLWMMVLTLGAAFICAAGWRAVRKRRHSV